MGERAVGRGQGGVGRSVERRGRRWGTGCRPINWGHRGFRVEASGKGWGGRREWGRGISIPPSWAFGETPDTVSGLGGEGEVFRRREKKALELLTGAMHPTQLTFVYTPTFCMPSSMLSPGQTGR